MFMDVQEIFLESSDDKVHHGNQVVGDDVSLDKISYYSNEGSFPPSLPPLSDLEVIDCVLLRGRR